MSTTATKDTELETTSVADLLQRVAALEAEQRKQIKKKNKLTIIAWGGNLDQIWPTTILATTAAASGMESSVFFTFWGLFAIVKPEVRITGDNWMQKMMSVMNPGSAQKAKLSRYLGIAKSGEIVLVTEHGRVVAAIGPPDMARLPPALEGLRPLVARGATIEQAEPMAHCPDCRRDFFPPPHPAGAG